MSRYCPSCGKPCSQSGCVCGWASQQERPPIYPDEQGDWAASNRGYERRIREWVSQGVHLQSHHVAYVLSQLDTVRERAEKAEQQLASLAAAQERMTKAVTRSVAELRHAYLNLRDNRVSRSAQHAFADGLLAPQIRRLETALAALPSLAASSREPEKETKD